MLIYAENTRKLSSTKGYVCRKKDGIVLQTPIYLGKGEKAEDYDEWMGNKPTRL